MNNLDAFIEYLTTRHNKTMQIRNMYAPLFVMHTLTHEAPFCSDLLSISDVTALADALRDQLDKYLVERCFSFHGILEFSGDDEIKSLLEGKHLDAGEEIYEQYEAFEENSDEEEDEHTPAMCDVLEKFDATKASNWEAFFSTKTNRFGRITFSIEKPSAERLNKFSPHRAAFPERSIMAMDCKRLAQKFVLRAIATKFIFGCGMSRRELNTKIMKGWVWESLEFNATYPDSAKSYVSHLLMIAGLYVIETNKADPTLTEFYEVLQTALRYVDDEMLRRDCQEYIPEIVERTLSIFDTSFPTK